MDLYLGKFTLPPDHVVDMYQTVFPESDPILPEDLLQAPTDMLLYIARVLNVPSHNLYYYDKTGKIKIPYAAVNPKTVREDIYYWKPLYNKQCACKSLDRDANLYAASHGCDGHPEFIRQNGRYYEYPTIFDAEDIRSLDERGVYHLWLHPMEYGESKFLNSRVYGVPAKNKQIIYLYIRALLTVFSKTHDTAVNVERFDISEVKYVKQIISFFERIVHSRTPELDEYIKTTFETRHPKRVFDDIHEYMDLMVNKEETDLEMNLILEYDTDEDLVELFTKYTDNQIEDIIGDVNVIGNFIIQDVIDEVVHNAIPNFETVYPGRYVRDDFLSAAANIVLVSQWRLLSSKMHHLCNNQQTIISQQSFENLPNFLAYGSINDGYTCYAIEDLEHSFNNYHTLGIFPDPYDTNKHFTALDIRQMGHVLPPSEFKTSLIEHSSLRGNYEVFIQWLDSHPEYRVMVEQYFIHLFELGMYLRRWNGPNHAYPLTETLTEGETFECAQAFQTSTNATIVGGQMGDILDQLNNGKSLILNLPIYQRINNQPTTIIYTIGELINALQPNERELGLCIRISSGQIAYTGAVYLDKIFGIQPPNFNYHQNIIAWH